MRHCNNLVAACTLKPMLDMPRSSRCEVVLRLDASLAAATLPRNSLAREAARALDAAMCSRLAPAGAPASAAVSSDMLPRRLLPGLPGVCCPELWAARWLGADATQSKTLGERNAAGCLQRVAAATSSECRELTAGDVAWDLHRSMWSCKELRRNPSTRHRLYVLSSAECRLALLEGHSTMNASES